MSFVGTLISGWLVDRIDPRKVLAAVYALRGSSLFILPFVTDATGLLVFSVIYGLDWFASGPGTVAIIAEIFGKSAVGRVFGLAFVSHQVGGALAAVAGGWVYSQFGDYQYAFVTGGILGLMAAGRAKERTLTGAERGVVHGDVSVPELGGHTHGEIGTVLDSP